MNPSLVERLEREASRHPGRYRMRLTALAVAGDLALTAAQIAPVFAIIFFGAVIANYPFFYWIAAAATVFFVWVMRPSFRAEGRELQRRDAPELFSALDTLRAKLRVPRRMEVRIDDAFNASAAESLGLLGLAGTRRVLTLGVPLLATLDRDELIAVIAHEFGHFSRRHGRLGHWLYRARVGWLKYAEYVSESESPLERAAVRYAGWFVPYFSVRSFVHSRRCEYEADADGALVVGADAFAGALTRIAITAAFHEEALPGQVAAWQEATPVAPADFHERCARAARDAATKDFARLLRRAVGERSGWSDTHPSLSDRLAALDRPPRLLASGGCAGESLIGELWPTILRESNDAWAKENAVAWALEHFRHEADTRDLMAAGPEVVSTWPLDRRLARARAFRRLEPTRGLQEMRLLYETNASSAPVAFAYASALLNEDDPSGVPLMARVLKSYPLYRLQGHARLLGYYERRNDAKQIERCRALVQHAVKRERKAVAALLEEMEEGKVTASGLPPRLRQALRQSIALDRAVRKAWLVQGTARLQIDSAESSLPVLAHVLVLCIEPHDSSEEKGDEEDVQRRYQEALAPLLAADEILVVRTFFTTETVPASLTRDSDMVHAA